MRRILALAVIVLAVVFATACGNDGGDGAGGPSTLAPAPETSAVGSATAEEVCSVVEERIVDLDPEGDVVRDNLIDAAESGDEAELAQARTEYLDFTSGFAEELRAIAATADDPALRAAVELFADEYEAWAEVAAENPEEIGSQDGSGLEAAIAGIGAACDWPTG